MNNKFKKVNEALMNKTREAGYYVRLTKNTDCRHKGKYAIQNVVTNKTYGISFKNIRRSNKRIQFKNLIIKLFKK